MCNPKKENISITSENSLLYPGQIHFDLSYQKLVFSVLGFQLDEIIEYVLFCVWLLLINMFMGSYKCIFNYPAEFESQHIFSSREGNVCAFRAAAQNLGPS